MKKMLPAIFMAMLGLLLASESFAGHMGLRYFDDFVPQPVLLEPTRETVDLTGREWLDFKWSPHEQARGFRDYYDFRLYKGYDMLESTLIMKQKVDPTSNGIRLPASMFEAGQVYTWSLRQVYDGYRKSNRSYQSFRVINLGSIKR